MRFSLIGYGKMGHMIEQVALQRGHEIVCRIDKDNQADFDSEAFLRSDVAIEFTTPWTAYDNFLKCFGHNIKVVSGSTGWMADHKADVERLCTEGGQTLFWASNFSVGMVIFAAVNRYLARIMDSFGQYDVRMEETHHVHKLDAPSGTAISLAEDLLQNIGRKTQWQKGEQHLADGTVTGSNDLAADTLAIECRREGEVPGIHSVIYNSDADEITITHNAHSRMGFALGAVLAAEYTARHKGLLTTSDLFAGIL